MYKLFRKFDSRPEKDLITPENYFADAYENVSLACLFVRNSVCVSCASNYWDETEFYV